MKQAANLEECDGMHVYRRNIIETYISEIHSDDLSFIYQQNVPWLALDEPPYLPYFASVILKDALIAVKE